MCIWGHFPRDFLLDWEFTVYGDFVFFIIRLCLKCRWILVGELLVEWIIQFLPEKIICYDSNKET